MLEDGPPAENRMPRALRQYLAPTVLILIGIAAVLAALLSRSLFGLPGLVLLASLVSKYAYVLLESAANGVAEPPPLSMEMVNPFEQRPLMQFGMGLVVAALIAWLPGPASLIIAVLALLLMPASIGVLGVSNHLLDAANPVVLLRTIVALGAWYPAILALTAACAAMLHWAFTAPLWGVARWALLLFCLLSLFTFLGSAFHARRLQLGFEPIHSPERVAERAATAQRRRTDQFLEELYGSVRLHDYAKAGAQLRQWAAESDDQSAAHAAHGIVQRALSWNDERGLALIASRLAAGLLRAGSTGAALDVVTVALPRAPMLRLATDAEQFALAQAARADGRRAVTAALLERFEQDFPESRLLARAKAMRAEVT
jgi:hypothetical protein